MHDIRRTRLVKGVSEVSEALTLDVPVDDAVFVEDVDSRGDLFAVQSDDVLLQP